MSCCERGSKITSYIVGPSLSSRSADRMRSRRIRRAQLFPAARSSTVASKPSWRRYPGTPILRTDGAPSASVASTTKAACPRASLRRSSATSPGPRSLGPTVDRRAMPRARRQAPGFGLHRERRVSSGSLPSRLVMRFRLPSPALTQDWEARRNLRAPLARPSPGSALEAPARHGRALARMSRSARFNGEKPMLGAIFLGAHCPARRHRV